MRMMMMMNDINIYNENYVQVITRLSPWNEWGNLKYLQKPSIKRDLMEAYSINQSINIFYCRQRGP